MTFLTSIQNLLTETEADAEVIILDIKQGIAVVESDIAKVALWIDNNAPTIAADVQKVLSIVTLLGIGANPDVAAAVTAANLAVAGLDAFAAASNGGATPTAAIISGYVAVKQATAAVSSAKAAAIAAPTAKAA